MYSREEKIKITEAFLESGLTMAAANRRPGWPYRKQLSDWVKEARDGKLPVEVAVPKGHTGLRSKHHHYSEKTMKEAVRLYEMGRRPVDIARLLGIDCAENIRNWWKKAKESKLAGEGLRPRLLDDPREESPMPDRKRKHLPPEMAELTDAELENACLRAVLADLKAGGFDLRSISNRRKTELGESLRRDLGLSLRRTTAFLKISKSSYEYHRIRLHRPDPLVRLKKRIVALFRENDARYGYRRIWAELRREGVKASEKVVRRIMCETGLIVYYRPKMKKWSSYAGEVSDAPANLVKRDFHADAPNRLWLTDITEFSLNGFKCYLSPVIDCFDGKVVAWSRSQSPDAELVNTMLDDAAKALAACEAPIIHSDRGAHYRWPGWIRRCGEAGLTRSMSAKGSSPDNAACEGFFGRLKNEFFYNRDWRKVSCPDFMARLDDYIRWYNEARIKKSLGWMSPVEYRKSQGLAA